MTFRQTYIKKTVLEAARDRIAFVFDHFESIIVSVSGGKDSTVLAHLALGEAKKRGRRIGLFFLDEEVVYDSTVKQVEYLMGYAPDNINRVWLQIPFYLTNATSVDQGQLLCWEPGKFKEWMRAKGENNIRGKPWDRSKEVFRQGYTWLDFYGALKNFELTQHNTAFLVGLRAAGESPNRFRAVVKNPVEIGGKKTYWATKKGENVSMYPIYDWNYWDVWRYIHEQGIRYSRVYEWQFMKGLGISEMRVSSLIHERSFKSLCELPEFEPKTYEKLCKRINGIAFVQETGKDNKGLKSRKLPKNFNTWRDYRDFLIETHRDQGRIGIFRARFAKQLENEYVARQQCRQLLCNDYENNLPVDNKPDPRQLLIEYYREVL